jgi:CheY-like chemotaxis protein
MDCNMPILDGYDATKQIRQFIQLEKLPQPIISAVTGHTEQKFVDQAFESGMNQVLEKPLKL